ncbi:hypothetical protein N7495_002558 [Penicillium taxi]|uniref:uncharacterized protein n=1 Tax=Penicillium taxi TaxID=168475 RepID=UPI00254506F6|nr:uncharacterized protein N7495_002558 [Penicillium taxi]KAJ5902030.1 hypothetical protein N7495_002558 [Penicillium taxi]
MAPRKNTKKQTRLAFAPAAPSSATDTSDANTSQDRLRTLSYMHPTLASVPVKRSRESKVPSKKTVCAEPLKQSQTSKGKPFPASESEVEIVLQNKAQSPMLNLDESSDDDVAIFSSQRSRGPKFAVPSEPKIPNIQDSSDSKGVTVRPQRRLKRKAESGAIENDSDSDLLISSPAKRRIKQKEDTTALEIESDDADLIISSHSKRRLKRKAKSPPIEIESDSDALISSPVRHRKRIIKPSTPQTRHTGTDLDILDIEEDVIDLQDSVVKKTRTRGHLAGSARNIKLQQLEALRRRRAGLPSESEDEPENGLEQSHIEEDEEAESETEIANHSNEDLDQYEDDFVLEDDALGVPNEEIPFEFTRHAYKKPKEYFRDVIGWMVHNALDPAFPRSDAMYKMAFMKLEDEVKARAGSLLISSVWDPDFRNALLARPYVETTGVSTMENIVCDACNRSGHPASADVKLYGKPYHMHTLEPILDDEDEDDSEDSDAKNRNDSKVERDRNGRALPNENKRFYLGRQCNKKAQLAHTLTHWRFHLNEWVVDHLRRMGCMTDAEVIRRNNMSQKKKTRNAIAVLESMVVKGEIDNLWRDFHSTLKGARERTVNDYPTLRT